VLRGHTKWALSLAFSPDGQQLLSGEHVTDSTAFADIKLWDVGSGRPLRSFRAHKGGVWWLAFNAQGDRFASAGSESLARVWDLDSGRQLSTLQHARGAVEGIAFRQDGSQLITLDAGDDHLKMWDPHTGQPLGEFTMPSESGRCLAISRDGRRVATGGAQGIARIWDAQTGAHLRDIRGHGLYVTSVAFAADGTRLFTASLDKTVRVWNADTGEELLALKGHSQGLWSVVVSPDGNKIASAGEDGTVVIWDANLVTDEIQLARKNVQRARRAVDERFAELALASDVIESLRGGTSFDSPTLELALQIAAARGDDPYRLIERSREICGQPHQEDSRYVEAHQYAQIACDAIPDAPELLAVLGLAEYRVRAYKAALETLRRCDETDRNQGSRPRPEVWSVMAMSNFQLGQREEAQAALKQAQALLQEPEWAENPVHHSLVQETAQLIDPQGSVLTATQPSSR
jgi:sugar lactone lactonase YvrE